MNFMISIPYEVFNISNVILKENTANKLIDDSTFCKLMYSTNYCHISGIPLYFHSINDTDDSFKNNIKQMETSILKLYQPYSTNKKCILKLYNHILKRYTKSYTYNNNYIIHLIGIWESKYEYGITFRISNHQ